MDVAVSSAELGPITAWARSVAEKSKVPALCF